MLLSWFSDFCHASQGKLEFDLHLVGDHGGIGPLVLPNLERQALDGEHTVGRGCTAALSQ